MIQTNYYSLFTMQGSFIQIHLRIICAATFVYPDLFFMYLLVACRAATGTGLGWLHVGPGPVFYGLNSDSDLDPIETMNMVLDSDQTEGSRIRTQTQIE